MVKLALRDDDLNAFTNVNDIDDLYKPLGVFPISFAVVPYITDVLGGCPETNGNKIATPLDRNPEVIDWLRTRLKDGQCDILLHGITHEYHFDDNGIKIPEMLWRKSDLDLSSKIKTAKEYLEHLLNCDITCFVAPNNIIAKQSLQCVVENGMHLSGIIPLQFERQMTFRNTCNYLKRFAIRWKNGIQYPGVLKYSDHLEINACGIGSPKKLQEIYSYCDRHNMPMVINTHYWNLRDNAVRRAILFDFVSFVLDSGAIPTTVSQILSEYGR